MSSAHMEPGMRRALRRCRVSLSEPPRGAAINPKTQFREEALPDQPEDPPRGCCHVPGYGIHQPGGRISHHGHKHATHCPIHRHASHLDTHIGKEILPQAGHCIFFSLPGKAPGGRSGLSRDSGDRSQPALCHLSPYHCLTVLSFGVNHLSLGAPVLPCAKGSSIFPRGLYLAQQMCLVLA